MLLFGDTARPGAEFAGELASPELVARIREAATRGSMWGNPREMYDSAAPDQAVRYAMDELATELASKLLGEGFGTAVSEIYGAFTADLCTGQLIDDPDVPSPPEME
jgi:hypothetical protein